MEDPEDNLVVTKVIKNFSHGVVHLNCIYMVQQVNENPWQFLR